VTYFAFLLVFVVPPTLVLVALMLRRPPGRIDLRRHWIGTGILILIALVWTTPWDNYLVANRIWTYGPDRVVGTVWFVPIEEYVFIVLEPILIASLLALLLPPGIAGSSRWRNGQPALRSLALLVGIGATLAGLLGLRADPTTYLGLILVWFVPPVLIQWLFDPATLVRHARTVLLGTFIPAGYLTLADSFALRDGIWNISAETVTGITLGNVPLEEFVFFAVTSLLVAQGLVLWHSLPVRPRTP
jgi:lycopene cyclase domain-containing protein